MSTVICRFCNCPSIDRVDDYCNGDCYVFFDKNEPDKKDGSQQTDIEIEQNADKKTQTIPSNKAWEKSFKN